VISLPFRGCPHSLNQINLCSLPSRQAPGTLTGCEYVNTFGSHPNTSSPAFNRFSSTLLRGASNPKPLCSHPDRLEHQPLLTSMSHSGCQQLLSPHYFRSAFCTLHFITSPLLKTSPLGNRYCHGAAPSSRRNRRFASATTPMHDA